MRISTEILGVHLFYRAVQFAGVGFVLGFTCCDVLYGTNLMRIKHHYGKLALLAVSASLLFVMMVLSCISVHVRSDDHVTDGISADEAPAISFFRGVAYFATVFIPTMGALLAIGVFGHLAARAGLIDGFLTHYNGAYTKIMISVSVLLILCTLLLCIVSAADKYISDDRYFDMRAGVFSFSMGSTIVGASRDLVRFIKGLARFAGCCSYDGNGIGDDGRGATDAPPNDSNGVADSTDAATNSHVGDRPHGDAISSILDEAAANFTKEQLAPVSRN